ncbi:Acid stress-induced BolA-like protein IbaG/YrbA, predicted regulator of iron metabolism [Marisediminitalea aggregata]|jgi:acid stress-induced BolA-like protein IbaG/YrbA|uniref:Acid stress-induced BolA-like protein IbaG/YrbA, predicted regulator of iron metabolism n=1 Tax=Marisediminitalea aggregata TaxID=634436 RepID=A0A1M5HLM8_9ALTE|nr:BolA family protein [Marisediminitalea aggregata]MAP20186.1 BolA family transcriptional regulator [Alteromonadaceae bacterium]MCP3861900.1 BolA family transcriptional regulator [Aestuariibacter sp.]HBY39432.1 BolA family transcriptional regulator [Alteromonas sp.]MAX42863.1 BolA family transcriptional regulator [Alteromonadaceae bacterium]MBL53297.1 BolA family transcriptional regulator [Alteromonadaceae bacterium]|tara:strand:+ start:422 stop:679 length:258 start_codon:yes stop_codon:yes gene_type:complete
MDIKEIETLLKDSLNLAEVYVKGEGSHFNIIAVSDAFADMSRVKRQQFVYAPLNPFIADGSMHAVSIKTFTEKDWQRERQFNLPQ